MQRAAGKGLWIIGAILAAGMILAGMAYPLGQYGSGWSSSTLHVDTLVFSLLYLVGWLLLLVVGGFGRLPRLVVVWLVFWGAAALFAMVSIFTGGLGGLTSLLAFIFIMPLAGLQQPGVLPAGLAFIGIPALMAALGAGVMLLLRRREKASGK